MKFVQKSQWAHMSFSPRSRASELKRLPSLKYYNILKWEIDSLQDSILSKVRIISKKCFK